MAITEKLKQLIKDAMSKQIVWKEAADRLLVIDSQRSKAQEEVFALGQARTEAFRAAITEARERYRGDRLIELDGKCYLLRINSPHIIEDSILELETDKIKEV